MVKRDKKQKPDEKQFYQLTTLVAGDFSLQEVLDKLTEAAVKITGVKACSMRLLDEDSGDLKMRSTYGLSEEYRNKGVVSVNDPVIRAAFDGEAVVLDDMRFDDRVKYKQAAIKERLTGQLTVAMNFKNKPIGVLRIYNPRSGQFTEQDVSLARAVASQCAVAITNAQLYQEAIEGRYIADQMRLAGIIQRRMIPERAPRMPGLDIAATYIPCFEVGGDFYDFLKLSERYLILTISDVIGKGIPAALMMSMFRGSVRAYADYQRGNEEIMDIIGKLNKLACLQCSDSEFITMFYAVIDVKDKTITYCNCGHEPAVLIRNGEVWDLQTGGLVLGVEPDALYDKETLKLEEGDCLVFYTDGLIDAVDFEGNLWGRENLIKVLTRSTQGTAAQMIDNITAYRRRFAGLSKQVDDTSIIAVKVGSNK